MNDDTLLYRQIHPNWRCAEMFSSQAFRPTPKDQGKLSAYSGQVVSAEASFRHWTEELSRESVGVAGITSKEAKAQDVDPVHDATAFPAHVSIDFTKHSGTQQRKIGDRLAIQARARGWIYQASADPLPTGTAS